MASAIYGSRAAGLYSPACYLPSSLTDSSQRMNHGGSIEVVDDTYWLSWLQIELIPANVRPLQLLARG